MSLSTLHFMTLQPWRSAMTRWFCRYTDLLLQHSLMSVCVFITFVVWNDSCTLTKKAFKAHRLSSCFFTPLYTCHEKFHCSCPFSAYVPLEAPSFQVTRMYPDYRRVTSQFWLKRCQSPVCRAVTPRALQSLAVRSSKCTSTVTASCQNPLKLLLPWVF